MTLGKIKMATLDFIINAAILYYFIHWTFSSILTSVSCYPFLLRPYTFFDSVLLMAYGIVSYINVPSDTNSFYPLLVLPRFPL